MKIGITGCEGLIGRSLRPRLRAMGHTLRGLDLVAPDSGGRRRGDIRDRQTVARFMDGLDAVIHLAAVSRVLVAEADPATCWSTNAEGTALVLEAAARTESQPAVLVVSSREVYGTPMELPVREDAPLCPINVYGRSKLFGEQAALAARSRGLTTAVVRLSNVYGDVDDHPDRVVPAFARAAAQGGVLVVQGRAHTFDFTHVDDAVHGLVLLVEALGSGVRDLPAIHLTTGRGTTLGGLAELAVAAGGGRARIVDGPPRTNDVSCFVGDPSRAQELLGWRAQRAVADGISDLVRAFAMSQAQPLRAAGANR